MIKKNIKLLFVTSIVILLPILVGAVLWNKLSEKLPVHWDASGTPDGYSSKPFAVLAMPMILLALHWFCALIVSADPKNKNTSGKMVHLTFWIVPAVSLLAASLTYPSALGVAVPVEVIAPVFVGLIFVIVGNYLPKCRYSYTVGIKLPWTLNNEENWAKTHRLAGKVWTLGGLAVTVTGFFELFPVMIAVILVMVLVPSVYSYILHRRGL